MSNTSLILAVLTGSISVFIDLPIFFVFGLVFVFLMVRTKKVELKVIPLFVELFLSTIIGWGFSKLVIHIKPELMQGEIKVFTIMCVTLFGYLIILYAIKNQVLEKFAERWLNKKTE